MVGWYPRIAGGKRYDYYAVLCTLQQFFLPHQQNQTKMHMVPYKVAHHSL